MTQINSSTPPAPDSGYPPIPTARSSSIPSTKTPTALRPSAQQGTANRIQKSTAIPSIKPSYRLPGRLAQKPAPVSHGSGNQTAVSLRRPIGQPHRPLSPLPNHPSASTSASTSLPRTLSTTDKTCIKAEQVTSPSSSVISDLSVPDLVIKMEGGKAVKTEPSDEIIDLDKAQSAKRSIAELWETATPAVKDLILCRHRLQQISKVAMRNGLSPTDALEVRSHLDKLSTFPFEENSYDDVRIAAAVKFVTKPEIFGDLIARRATSLREKWKSGDFSPEPFLDDEDQLVDSSNEEEYETSDTEAERPPLRRDPGCTTVSPREMVDECVARHLRGIIIGRGKQGTKIYKLDPYYPKKPADVFGHNRLRVGDWWPFQTFALKDGAHGSKMGGIHGRTNLGAFSVVVSGGIYEGNDSDSGDRILYSGSKGGSEEDATSEAPYTNATKSLVVSTKHNKPVRVLRSSRNNSRWSPSAGIRYDGLYNVESYTIRTDGERKKFYQFVLVRVQDQAPIDRTRPTAVEIAALDRIKEM
ncbi:hypothetical protein L211DRAFT_849713 [Terfezia boudieri ATCC MYA-4762]|uniref:YDG domain-containing protein n=1 Tax=Terfezia boudieri ATCC MYA-4762 TaxID=1051890 RepID=A0A3N4LKH9_9PEZI|nr:hypothetical protein L211DRAFT_849713 [Terfezia boudieri ATCC MYA-4762]